MYYFIVIYGETAEWVHMQIFLIFHSLSCRSKRRDTICDTERRRSYEVLKGDVLGFWKNKNAFRLKLIVAEFLIKDARRRLKV